MRVCSGFNSAILLAVYCLSITIGAAVAVTDESVRDDPRCSASLSVVLENDDGSPSPRPPLENAGDLTHNGVTYPAKVRWTDGNFTYGCICRLYQCIQKCCKSDEVLREDLTKKPVCEKMSSREESGSTEAPNATRTPELRLAADQMAKDLQYIHELKEHFLLIKHLDCPSGTYALNPDQFEEDKVVLQRNGNLVGADGKIFPLWNYCLDWQVTFDRIGILVCLTSQEVQSTSPNEKHYTVHHVGIIISIPFLFATFLVYAITPELKNLYGKTLMCYVICLIIAYVFLILANYINIMSLRSLCIVTVRVIAAVAQTFHGPYHKRELSRFSMFGTSAPTMESTMCRFSLVVCAFLLASHAAEDQTNFANNREQNETVPYESHVSFITGNSKEADLTRYKLSENTTKNVDESVQYEFRNFTKTDHEDNEDEIQYEFHPHSTQNQEDKNQMPPHEPRINTTQVQEKINFTSMSELRPGNSSGKNEDKESLVYKCNNTICIPICCEIGNRMINSTCLADQGFYPFPVSQYNATDPSDTKQLNEIFPLTVWDPCHGGDRFKLNPVDYPDDDYMFLSNGSLYLNMKNTIVDTMSYCLAVLREDKYEVTMCHDGDNVIVNNTTATDIEEKKNPAIPVGLVISLPFLLLTFIVYTVLPELKNMHGYTLRGYVSSLFVAYTTLAVINLSPQEIMTHTTCIVMAFIIYFSFLASFFWLNVMCFDIWWTFGGFRSLQGSVKQREKKKFIMYSIYAWGSASILTIVCAIMDLVSTVPKNMIRPEFGVNSCWFNEESGKAAYFYGPMGVTVLCNICLFISTALKIVRHKKDTAHHLRGSESRRHDDNKQWFNLYLKLFIVMGINWSMEIISWLFPKAPPYVWYLTDIMNTLQGLIIFIIFVWKDKIKRLLLKRFGCQNRGLFSGNSSRSGCHSSASRTCTTTTSGVMPLQEKISPYVPGNYRAKNSSDEADYP